MTEARKEFWHFLCSKKQNDYQAQEKQFGWTEVKHAFSPLLREFQRAGCAFGILPLRRLGCPVRHHFLATVFRAGFLVAFRAAFLAVFLWAFLCVFLVALVAGLFAAVAGLLAVWV